MSLTYDSSYQDWKKLHPDPVKPKPPTVDPKQTVKKIVKADTKKKEPIGSTWSPQMAKNMGFKTRADWRRWKAKGYANTNGGRAGNSGAVSSFAGGGGLW